MGVIEYDPFAIFTAPPSNETPEEKIERERREAEEKRVSDRIDEEIKAEKAALKKQKGVVKVLLLGQSESGKSTTLKNFRMKYARAAWKAERLSWRAVIQLNLIRSIITIVETLQAEMDNIPITPLSSSLQHHHHHRNPNHNYNQQNHHQHPSDPERPSMDSDFPESEAEVDSETDGAPIELAEKHRVLMRRLGPLRRVAADLKRRLGAGTEEVVAGSSGEGAGAWASREKEFVVRGWKNVLEGPFKGAKEGHGEQEDGDEATEVIASCKEDMQALWTDTTVREVLERRRLRLEDSAGFFLNDLDRIATRTYEPSDDDIVRARLRTLGVQEYKIQFEQNSSFLGNVGLGGDFGRDWILYDVGGSRTVRHAWVPYFEALNAIIFLAPISCFDERLREDPTVNRLEDSFLLWRAVCGSKILAKSTIILFLNKCDLLKKKLREGAQVKTYLPSYGERPNEPVAVVKYLKEKFKDILRQQSPEPRVSYFYATSVTVSFVLLLSFPALVGLR
ncbi:putative G protein alpha subunit [Lyophyllum shimeji]|uniref:G protein alpha subunit n=1 Tax=Lyophyllum shimeji TaxID=47721 RepID=A0A9P3PN56_LYOSH|nr:putative G protein alpha subunit [Lyophyllum shimeji]